MSDLELEADRAEEETPLGQARRRFENAARTLAFATVQHEDIPHQVGYEVMDNFLVSFAALEALDPTPPDGLVHPEVAVVPIAFEDLFEVVDLTSDGGEEAWVDNHSGRIAEALANDVSEPGFGEGDETTVVTDMNGDTYSPVRLEEFRNLGERYTILPPTGEVE